MNYDIETKQITPLEEFVLLGLPLFLFIVSVVVIGIMAYAAFRLYRKITSK